MMMDGMVPVPKATVMTMETAKMRTPSAAARVARKSPAVKRCKLFPEARTDELIRRHQLAFEVARQKEHTDNDAAEQVAQCDLQEPEVTREGEAGDADDGEGAGLRGDDGQRDGPPRHVTVGKEVRPQRPLAVAKAESEQGNAQQIEDDDGDVDEVKLHCTRYLLGGASVLSSASLESCSRNRRRDRTKRWAGAHLFRERAHRRSASADASDLQ